MINSVCIIGALRDRCPQDERIRYLLVERFYSTFINDEVYLVPICNWNKESKGEIFTFADGSLVAIRGRIETLNQMIVIVCETITYLGLKN